VHTPARFEGYAVPRHPLDAPRDGPGIHVLVDFHLLNVGIFLAFCAIIPFREALRLHLLPGVLDHPGHRQVRFRERPVRIAADAVVYARPSIRFRAPVHFAPEGHSQFWQTVAIRLPATERKSRALYSPSAGWAKLRTQP